MTELKTLKDIAQPFDQTAVLARQEAIKWIKELNNQKQFNSNVTVCGNQSVIDWIKHFFNISDKEVENA